MLTDGEIIQQNPWWRTPEWQVTDAHLRRLGEMPARLPVHVVDGIDLRAPGIHVLRGPRQVGKSTALKLLVERALERVGPRSVTYLALDLLEGQPVAEIARTVRRARALAGTPPDERRLIMLDEVTVAAGWQTVVKSLWDDGDIDRDVVVCTGSSSIDLVTGAADRLPGRRGAGEDHLLLPASFASFARALDGGIPASPDLRLADVAGAGSQDLLSAIRLHRPALDLALERYLVFGGLPAAVAEATTGAAGPSPRLVRIAEDALLREIGHKGASEPATWALMERVLRSLGSRVSWDRLAREMDVPLGPRRRPSGRLGPVGNTVRDYVEYLALGYFLLVVYSWRPDSDATSPGLLKKLYFADPILAQATLRHAPGLRFDVPAMVENLVAVALFRRYEPISRRIGGFHDPDDLHVWVTRKSGEIDFVAGPRGSLDACEVKYRRHLDLRSVAKIPRVLPGRPVCVATRDDWERRHGYTLVPTSVLLWALGG